MTAQKPETTTEHCQQVIARVYPNEDVSIDYMLNHLRTKCADVTYQISVGAKGDAVDLNVTHGLSWIFAICNKLGISFGKAFLMRFPGVCSYCLSAPCTCSATSRHAISTRGIPLSQEEYEYDLEQFRTSHLKSEFAPDLRWIRQKVLKIYPANAILLQVAPDFVGRRLHEELAELHRVYSRYCRKLKPVEAIGAELADVAAWLLSCWDVMKQQKSLDAEFMRRFAAGCPSCGAAVCRCERFSISVGQEEVISSVREALQSSADGFDEALDRVKKEALEEVSQIEATGKQLDKLLVMLDKIMKSVDSGTTLFQKVVKIYNTLTP